MAGERTRAMAFADPARAKKFTKAKPPTNDRPISRKSKELRSDPAAGEPLIVIRDLVKRFKHKYANNGIDLVISKGDRLAILGANGSGKTTLVEQIAGLTRPTSGSIEYRFAYRKAPQERIGVQFQSSSYPEGISVKDMMQFSMDIYNKHLSKEQTLELLNVFQMADFYKSQARNLSGGQQQKLNVLLAILHSPELVILDEISTGLDVLAREQILSFIQKFADEGNLSLVLISHHMAEIEQLCNRAVVLSRGKVIISGSLDQLKGQYGSLEAMMRKVVSDEMAAGVTEVVKKRKFILVGKKKAVSDGR